MAAGLQVGKDWRQKYLWYAVQTRAKSEHIAAAALSRSEGIEVYCPRLKFQRQTRRGRVWFTEALFPGYIFARFMAATHMRAVSYGTAVTRVLQLGNRYASVPDAAIDQIREQMGGGDTRRLEASAKVGEEVEITTGPLQGMTATVTGLMQGKQRVKLLIEFLGRVSEAELSVHDVQSDRVPQQRFALG
jgi:transcriptional antiterminator RfaH